MAPKARGSKVRVKPHPDMAKSNGHLAKVKIDGEIQDVLFDALYLKYWQSVTGLSPFPSEVESEPLEIRSSAKESLDAWLKSGNITLDKKNPRHSMLLKYIAFVEDKSNES
jgi:hypothetical protein